ncbi:MAG: metallopeptidase family protein [candidate division WOR-3 bacterium]
MKIEREKFEALIIEAIKTIPKFFRDKMENVEIVIEDYAPAYIQNRLQIHPYALFGLYQGIPRNKRGSWYGNVLPDKITIFQKPIEQYCQTEVEMKELVKKVVMHEIGHYFGLSEAELRQLEKE